MAGQWEDGLSAYTVPSGKILDLWVYLCPKAHAKDCLEKENTILDIGILGQAKDIGERFSRVAQWAVAVLPDWFAAD